MAYQDQSRIVEALNAQQSGGGGIDAIMTALLQGDQETPPEPVRVAEAGVTPMQQRARDELARREAEKQEAPAVNAGPAAQALGETQSQPESNPYASSMRQIVNDLNAGYQGINPVATARERPVGVVNRGPDGSPVFIDVDGVKESPENYPSDKFATQIDPQTGMELVYMRKPEIEDSSLSSLGRILAYSNPGKLAPGWAKTTAASRLGVNPSLGMQGAASARIASALEGNIVTASPIVRDAERAAGELADAAKDVAGKVGTVSDRATAGMGLRRGADDFVAKTNAKTSDLYGKVDELIPGDMPFEMSNTSSLIQDMLGAFKDTPNIGKTTGLGSIKRWASDIQKNGGMLTWEQVSTLRTEVGYALKGQGELSKSLSKGRLKQIYGALSDDMGEAARMAGAEKEWNRATNYARGVAKRKESALDIFFGKKSDEGIYDAVEGMGGSAGRANIQKLSKIKASMPGEEWRDFVATTFDRLGQPTPGAVDQVFSSNTFMTRWNKMSPAAKRILLTGDGISPQLGREIDDLVELVGDAKKAGVEINSSRSGANIGNTATILAAIMGGATDPTLTALGFGAARLTAEALTNVKVIRALKSLAKPSSVQAGNALRVLAQAGVLPQNDEEQ